MKTERVPAIGFGRKTGTEIRLREISEVAPSKVALLIGETVTSRTRNVDETGENFVVDRNASALLIFAHRRRRGKKKKRLWHQR